MNLSDTFRSHAQECQRMASSMRDAADKATWSQMAKRWLAYAECSHAIYVSNPNAVAALIEQAASGVK